MRASIKERELSVKFFVPKIDVNSEAKSTEPSLENVENDLLLNIRSGI